MITKTIFPVDAETLNLIAEIDEFKGAWRALGTLAPERLTALRQVATIESIGSSTRIEGSKLSNAQVQTLLSGLSDASFTSRDEQEVAGYAAVMDLVFEAWESIALDENHIFQFHRELLRYSQKDDWHRGKYKTTANNVVAFDADGQELGVVFETATPFDTPLRMRELIEWFNSDESQQLHPLIKIAVFVVTFLEIHPFQDGNGRLSRVLTSFLLLKLGYAYVPYASLESVIEKSKDRYYAALRATQVTIRTDSPNWHPWLAFFLVALQRQKDHLAVKLERERLLLVELTPIESAVLTHVREHGRVTLTEAVALSGGNKNTVKKQMQKLVAAGHLELVPAGRSSWYRLTLK